ncbi:amine oxidase [flavin-containing] [Parasteatoda tepidariorum]|uniref:amine oxidase [flavin-containing] n=1 Tax=Parasteatoda tepidariorum TaxID=114398 RepID=UPI001C725088|nr:amine oxidase [flavin-containing] [Parasteatoda tepidariorum]
MDFTVAIVGAGLSGLSAAKWLCENGASVTVLEANDRIGGRCFTKLDPKVGYVDLGGSYIGPTQDHILRLAKDLEVETYLIKEEEDLLHYNYGRRIRSKDDNFKHKNPFADMEIKYIIRLMDKLSKEIPYDSPWNSPHADEYDTMTFKEFLDKNCWTSEAKTFFKNIMNLSITSDPYEVSFLNMLFYTKQCGGFKRYMGTENGAQERKFKGGSQQICEKLALKINAYKGSQVITNSPVIGINQESTDYVTITTLKGETFKAKYVILACPPVVQMKIHFTPPLPPLRNQLLQRLPMGTTFKNILYYETAFWKEKGLCGTIYIEGGDEHPMYLAMDDTKPDGSYPALIGFIPADHCRSLLDLTPEQRKEILARSLAQATGLNEFLHPVHYEEKNWMAEQYIGGCYTAIYPPGFFTRYGRALRQPIDRLYFAGTETAIYWSGYMTGAVEAGERAAREILHSLGKITKDQIWIKEPESKDIVAKPFTYTLSEKYSPSVGQFLKWLVFSGILGSVTVAAVFVKRFYT